MPRDGRHTAHPIHARFNISMQGNKQNKEVVKAIAYIVSFCVIAFVCYGKFAGDSEVHPTKGPGSESWDFIDACYFTMVTITTIGYGDMHPTSDAMKGVTIFFVLIGIMVIANCLGIIATWVGQQKKALERRAQQKTLEKAKKAGEAVRAIQQHESSESPDTNDSDDKAVENDEVWGKLSALDLASLFQDIGENTASILHKSRHEIQGLVEEKLAESIAKLVYQKINDDEDCDENMTSGTVEKDDVPAKEDCTRPEDTKVEGDQKSTLVKVKSGSCSVWLSPAKRQLYFKVNKCLYSIYFYVALSLVMGMVIEEWTFLDSLYYSTVTMTTVGYGDISPQTKGGRAFSIFLLPFGVMAVTNAIGSIADVFDREKQGTDASLRDKIEELKVIIADDDDGEVTPEEFILYNLKKMGKVDQETIECMREQFKALDADGSESLDLDDVELLLQQCDKLGI